MDKVWSKIDQMQRTSATAIEQIRYHPRRPGTPIEVFTLASLRKRVSAVELEGSQRIDFHLVIVCTGGDGSHEVDVAPVQLSRGRVLHIRPTQVHRWSFDSSYRAILLVFPEVPELRVPIWPQGPRWFDRTKPSP